MTSSMSTPKDKVHVEIARRNNQEWRASFSPSSKGAVLTAEDLALGP